MVTPNNPLTNPFTWVKFHDRYLELAATSPPGVKPCIRTVLQEWATVTDNDWVPSKSLRSMGVVEDTALALEHFVFKTHYHNEPSKGFIAIAVKP